MQAQKKNKKTWGFHFESGTDSHVATHRTSEPVKVKVASIDADSVVSGLLLVRDQVISVDGTSL